MITNVLNNKSMWKLFALMSYSPGAGYTRSEIMALLKWNNLSLDRSLKKAEFYKIIKKEKRLIKINFENPDANKIIEVIEYEKKKLNYPQFKIFVLLNEFARRVEAFKIDSIYLFGSHAKKTASLGSDVDIAVFSKDKVNLIEAKQAIFDEFEKEIQLHYFSPNEKSKLVDEVLKHGVRLL